MSEKGWRYYAACKGQDINIFFPVANAKYDAVEQFCKKCRVSDLCLNEALVGSRVHGIWGGTTQKERTRIRGWANVRLH